MNRFLIRTVQFFTKIALKFIIWKDAIVFKGENVIGDLPKYLQNQGFKKIFIVTDSRLYALGMTKVLEMNCQEIGLTYQVFYDTVANPTIDSIEMAYHEYKQHQCDAIVALGGGSSLDTAKMVGARSVKPHTSIRGMRGYLKIGKKIPHLTAIPTTSGSGSEATIVAVVSDAITHEKYAITDPHLIPKVVVLDPLMTVNLPAYITACTGMDALTHAIECLIGRANTKKTYSEATKAIKLIFDNLEEATNNPHNLVARENMQEAAYLAGKAFTKGYVGYVHALAHPLSGYYNIPHGEANAVILPLVLKKDGDSINKPLKIMGDLLNIGKNAGINRQREMVIEQIIRLNEVLGITTGFSQIRDEDIEGMVDNAIKEAHPMYPVPKILTKEELKDIYQTIKK